MYQLLQLQSEWFGFRVIAQLSTIIGSAVWLLSMYFFYLTCRILVECFDGLYKRMSSLPPLSADFPSLKMEHHKLCEVVEVVLYCSRRLSNCPVLWI